MKRQNPKGALFVCSQNGIFAMLSTVWSPDQQFVLTGKAVSYSPLEMIVSRKARKGARAKSSPPFGLPTNGFIKR